MAIFVLAAFCAKFELKSNGPQRKSNSMQPVLPFMLYLEVSLAQNSHVTFSKNVTTCHHFRSSALLPLVRSLRSHGSLTHLRVFLVA